MEPAVDNALIVKKIIYPGNKQAVFNDGAKVRESGQIMLCILYFYDFCHRYHFIFKLVYVIKKKLS